MRPTTYTPEIGDEICALLADGVSLTKICAADKYPSTVTVYSWLRKHPEFLNNYTRAREDQADTLADEIIEISDDGSNDTYTDEDGHTTTNFDVIARSRLRVEARKWVAAKLKPKKYGDRATHEITGANGGPIESKVTVEFVNPTP